MVEILEQLTALGLTKTEARIYVALLELGEARTGKLCDTLDIPTSHVYRHLDSLMKKGLVGYKLANNVKVFKPNDPESLSLLYQKKKEELEAQERLVRQAIPTLRAQPVGHETASDYKYFEGIHGIKALWLEINELLIPNTQAGYYTGTADSWKALNAFYLEHHRIRARKKVALRMILPRGTTILAQQRKKTGLFDYRFSEITSDGEFGVYENFVVIQYTSRKEKVPRGFLIKDKIFVETFRGIFKKLWDGASPR